MAQPKKAVVPAKAPQPNGRPRIEIDLAQVERLATIQCTDDEIAAVLGVSLHTVARRKAEDPAFLKVLEEGRGKGKATLRRIQWQRASKGSDTMCIWLGKQLLGQRDKHELTGEGGGPIQIITGVRRPVEIDGEYREIEDAAD